MSGNGVVGLETFIHLMVHVSSMSSCCCGALRGRALSIVQVDHTCESTPGPFPACADRASYYHSHCYFLNILAAAVFWLMGAIIARSGVPWWDLIAHSQEMM